jgi:hypothetical protein
VTIVAGVVVNANGKSCAPPLLLLLLLLLLLSSLLLPLEDDRSGLDLDGEHGIARFVDPGRRANTMPLLTLVSLVGVDVNEKGVVVEAISAV